MISGRYDTYGKYSHFTVKSQRSVFKRVRNDHTFSMTLQEDDDPLPEDELPEYKKPPKTDSSVPFDKVRAVDINLFSTFNRICI
jgi:hypothetical protein